MNQKSEQFVRESGYAKFWENPQAEKKSEGVNQAQSCATDPNNPPKYGDAKSYSVGYSDGANDALKAHDELHTRSNQLINQLYHQIAQLENTVKHAAALISYGVGEFHSLEDTMKFEAACRQWLSQHGGS